MNVEQDAAPIPARRGFPGPLAMCRSLASRWDLTRDFAYRELVGRYRGSVLGVFWSLIQPLFMLATYTVVFGIIIPIHPALGITGFAFFLFSGMIGWNLMSEGVGAACALILNRQTFVKKVVFPLEILPLVQVLVAVAHFFFALSALLVALLIVKGGLEWTVVLVPLYIVPLVLFTLGATWLLASLGVFIRDLGETVGVILMAWMFLTPVFYGIENIDSPIIKTVLYVNPMTLFVIDLRLLLLDGQVPPMLGIGVAYIAYGVFAWLGYVFFMKTRDAFGDVI